MLFIRVMTVIVAGVLTMLAVRHVAGELNAAKVRVKAKQPDPPRAATRLRQDPRSGIYYPEN